MAEFLVTPLGTSPAWYNPGEPTSGFLLQAGDYRLLVDCGAGVIARYLDEYGFDSPIDAVIISHCHADHIVDLVPFKYALEYGGLEWTPQLWLPPGAHGRLQRMVSAWDGPSDFFSGTFSVRDYTPGEPFEVGPFAVEALSVPHYIESVSLRFRHNDATFGYSGDLGPSASVAPFMQDVDLLLCEATFTEDHGEPADARGHLCGSEAGAIARDAAARSLLLTHVPVVSDRDAVLAAAQSVFGGPAALAQPLTRYVVEQHLAKV